MLGGEVAGVAGGLREADQHDAHSRDPYGGRVLPEQVEIGDTRYGQAPRHVADERDTVGVELEQDGREDPAGNDHERPGDPRGDRAKPEERSERDRSDEQRCAAEGVEPLDPGAELLPDVVAVGLGARQLRELADRDVDRGPEEEAGDHRPREELGDPPQLEDEHEQEERACDEGDTGDERGRVRHRSRRRR